MELRLQEDPRMCDGSILDKRADGSCVMHFMTPKPPIPLMSKRENVLEVFNIKDYGSEGRFLNIMRSTEHSAKPIKTGMFSDVRLNVTC